MKKYRYFAGLMGCQARWLNRMSEKGYRLVGTGKLEYEFENCVPGAYEYCVEFVGHLSWNGAEDYKAFLEELDYRVFYKNTNLQYSVGKAQGRLWAERGGRLATRTTTLDRELLIVEKRRDGQPFALHTQNEDRRAYLRLLQRPWIGLMLLFLLLSLTQKNIWLLLPVLLLIVPVALYELEIKRVWLTE